MKLKFKKQQYQTDAVMSLVNCFKGQQKGYRKDIIGRQGLFEEISFGNAKLTLTDSELRENVRSVQKVNDIPIKNFDNSNNFTVEMETGTGKTYTYIKSMYELNKHYGWSKFIIVVPSIAIREGVYKSFEITADHFQEEYGQKIRYFIYDSKNSSNMANINSFASDSNIQVMIINYQAFNSRSKENKKIFEELDTLQSRRPIDIIKSVHPIMIIDEPQKIGDSTADLLKEFNPLFTVGYSATHKKDYNKIYRLDAIDAYNNKLVKKINVKGIELLGSTATNSYLFLDSVNISKKHAPTARMEIEVKIGSGIKRQLKTFHAGDNLFDISNGLEQYRGYVISEIDGRYENYDKVHFTNGIEIAVGQAFGDVDIDHIRRIQIRETIRSHFEKERELFKVGVKVLSLFFIDEVAKYKFYENDDVAEKGEYARIFEEEYINLLNEFKTLFDDVYNEYLDSFDASNIHAGYFSVDKKGRAIDSSINDKKTGDSFDQDAYDLIMKDKERLLSLEEPVRFIFSHSALKEGWDNPNIFQICTLKHSNSYISKRQEIGRGLRISVNNAGERMDSELLENDFHKVNTLTVVASESYDEFAKSLQEEILESLSDRPKILTVDVLKEKILVNSDGKEFHFDDKASMDFVMFCRVNEYIDADYKVTEKFIVDMEKNEVDVMPNLIGFEKEVTNLLKKIYDTENYKPASDKSKENIKELIPNKNFDKKEFQELWKKINKKTIYEVEFDTEELVEKSINSINANLVVNKIDVVITTAGQKDTIDENMLKNLESITVNKKYREKMAFNVNSNIKYDLIGDIASGTNLTRKTVSKILSAIHPNVFEQYKQNPENFIKKAISLINTEKATTIIEGITYHKIDQEYSNEIFTDNNMRAELGVNAIQVKKHIYDYVITDSKNEKTFAEKLESGEVSVYAKLPNGFKIPTPVGNYNPDWAIVFDNPTFKQIYFIAETKGSMDSLQLREVEKTKIECAKKHFDKISNSEVKYGVVDSYEELINLVSN